MQGTALAHRYILEAPIARGGMATVWRARDDILARTVAVKMLHDHLARDDDFVERFKREALAAARLSHPHIVSIYDTGREPSDDGGVCHYIVMEHCGRSTLAGMLERSGPLDPHEVVAVGSAICDALAYAHRAGIIHRDIKPANVLVCDDGALKVADFGIAKAAFAAGDLTTTGSILGTVTYLAPEQLSGLEPDARSDMYSLGVLLYELLAGHPPFEADSQLAIALQHQRDEPPPLRTRRAGIPRVLETAVMRALDKDPERRYESVTDMRSALEGRVDGDSATTAVFRTPPARRAGAPQPVEPAPKPGPSESRRLIPILAFVVVAVALALVVPPLLLTNDDDRPEAPRSRSPRPTTAPAELAVESVDDFDPYGGDGEHPEEADLAVDGDTATAWRTSTYFGPLDDVKPGVGLLFDLGRARAVTRARVVTPTPGFSFELRAGRTVGPDETSLEIVEAVDSASRTTTVAADAHQARYWLVWITSLPGGEGGSAHVSEVEFLGT